MSRLKVHLFGGVRLHLSGRVIARFRSQKVAALLAYLLVHRARVHSRVELATLFFPEHDESRARTYLRTTLYQLKKVLQPGEMQGDPYLLITPQTIGFNPESDYWLDVEEFERLLNHAPDKPPRQAYEMRLEALELYCGDFVAGYFEDWILREQERLRLRYQEALKAAAEYEESQGHPRKAIEHLRELLTLSPLQEGIHRWLIRLFLQIGDPGAAWKQYHLCERLLMAELGVAPEPETQALHAQLEAHRPSRHDPRQAAHREMERGWQALDEGHQRAAERLLQIARRRLAELQDPAEAEALHHLGRLALKVSKPDLAQRRFARAQALARRNQDTALQAMALNGLGAAESARARLNRAREYYQSALRLAEQGHHPEIRWRALNNLGRNHWLQGRYGEALRCYVGVQLLCEQLHERRGLLIVLQNLGTLYSHLGLFEEAHRCYQEAHALAEGVDTLTWQRSLWHNWGDIHEREGRAEHAARCYRRGYEISWELNDALGCAASLCNLGRVLGALGDLRHAERYLARALRRAEASETSSLEVEACSALAQVRLAQGRRDEALELSTCAIDLIQQGVPVEDPEGIHLAHAEILISIGDHAAARRTLRKAWKLLEQRAGRLKRDDYRRSFLENVPRHRRIKTLLREC